MICRYLFLNHILSLKRNIFMSETFSETLKYLRNKKGVSQKELGDVLNYGSTAISNYETGRNEPSLKDLCRLADYFEVNIDFLLGRSESSSRLNEDLKRMNEKEERFWHAYKSLSDENRSTVRKFAYFLKNEENIKNPR